MDLFPLPLFPQGSLASSVITTVWIGVAVVAFFNLRFGWVLSGLVVPGYLVPLILIKPWSALVVVLEAIITYLIVYVFSEVLSRAGHWSSLFGRDRFFALVLVSVLVRVIMDGWLLPDFGAWLTATFDISFDYRNNLHSFGLIIIALIANQFWKTGLIRGLLPLVVVLGVTLILVRYVLMVYTNFSISTVGYMYEDIASSILASPKAYIILLTAALVASRMNLLYGWDFSGILIPSLLALQWYQPGKIVVSLLEALIILLIAIVLLRLPPFRNANMEGARKLLLFFNIGFVYKMMLGWVLLLWFPEIKVTDTFAFGYLLATLMAMKMHDKDIAIRMSRATLQTSLVGVAIASLLGFALTLLPLRSAWVGDQQLLAQSPEEVARASESLSERIQAEKIRFYGVGGATISSSALPNELQDFEAALQALKRYLVTREPKLLQQAQLLLGGLGLELLEVESRYLMIREGEARGWGSYVLDTRSARDLLVGVPAPLDERGSVEAALQLFKTMQARALAIAGSKRGARADGSLDVLVNRQTPFQVFHRTFGRRDALQLRGYTAHTMRAIAAVRSDRRVLDASRQPDSLWVHKSLPPGLDVAKLKSLLGTVGVEWDALPLENRQREVAYGGFAELTLSPDSMRRVRARSRGTLAADELRLIDQRIDGYLQEWILSSKEVLARRGSEDYAIPDADELLYFDEEVLTPLLALIDRSGPQSQWQHAQLEELSAISAAAAGVGYQTLRYRHQASGEDFIILQEREQEDLRRYWGTYVFRLGGARSYVVQVPRPIYEINSFEYGVALFERLQGRVLMIAGAHPDANSDGSADVVRKDNFVSLFSLINQVVLREAGNDPMLVLHSRALGYRRDTPLSDADLVLSVDAGLDDSVAAAALVGDLLSLLEKDGLRVRKADGSAETAGYEVGNVPQSQYLQASVNKAFAALWIAPHTRAGYRQQSDNRQEIARFAALDIETLELDLARALARTSFAGMAAMDMQRVRESVQRYREREDVITLMRLQREWPQLRLQRLLDRDSRQSFLLLSNDDGVPVLLANLHPLRDDSELALAAAGATLERWQEFVDRRISWMMLEANR